MRAHRTDPTLRRASAPTLHLVAREHESPWQARAFDELVPPDTLEEARLRRDDLTRLLRREREAGADFLLALADFDRRRGWERLGHASLFAFLTRELRLSKGAAFLRLSAARLLPAHPAVEQALRTGALCLSAVGELAKVLTRENEASVLPRFLGCSAREAREVVAALAPRADPPVREVVTRVGPPVAAPAHELTLGAVLTSEPRPAMPSPTEAPAPPAAASAAIRPTPLTSVDPLTADLRRLHVTVSRAFLDKVAQARDGLSHVRLGATTEQVLEAALDALLERQARRRAQVKRRRAGAPHPSPSPLRGEGERPVDEAVPRAFHAQSI